MTTPKIDPPNLDYEALKDCAHLAYARRGPSYDTPSSAMTEIQTEKGIDYIILQNGNGLLAKYRIGKDGSLRSVDVP